MLERWEEKSAEMLLDELLNKGIIVDRCLLWRAGDSEADVDPETSWEDFEHHGDA